MFAPDPVAEVLLVVPENALTVLPTAIALPRLLVMLLMSVATLFRMLIAPPSLPTNSAMILLR